jgi:hypothetical protein
VILQSQHREWCGGCVGLEVHVTLFTIEGGLNQIESKWVHRLVASDSEQ